MIESIIKCDICERVINNGDSYFQMSYYLNVALPADGTEGQFVSENGEFQLHPECFDELRPALKLTDNPQQEHQEDLAQRQAAIEEARVMAESQQPADEPLTSREEAQ